MRWMWVAALLALPGGPVYGFDLSGTAGVTDGDTLVVAGRPVRLQGIDAPERAQTCLDAVGRRWECGLWAGEVLSRLTNGQSVRCEIVERDRYGRDVGTCRVGETDLGGAMVRRGAAYAYRAFSRDYVAQEQEASAQGRGLWRGAHVPPWEFRRTGRAEAGAGAIGRCRIKGNISRNGKIYHLPGQRSYAATRIDETRGERWFCSEKAAKLAGWRAPARQ